MRWMALARRNWKEIRREPLNLAFGIGFPLILLGIITALQSHIPASIFEIQPLFPGIVVFGFSFLSLFAAMLIAKDRETSLLLRLFTTPMPSRDYILGYLLPMFPIAMAQLLISYAGAIFLGLPLTFQTVLSLLAMLPTGMLFIGIGLWAGSVLSDKLVGGVCGALLINVSAWLSGTWFDLEMVGGWFKRIADVLPFVHAVQAGRAAVIGDWSAYWPHLLWVSGYVLAIGCLAVAAFRRQMSGERG